MKTCRFWVAGSAATVMLAASLPAHAVADKKVARCAAIDNDLDRLECFDTLAREAGLDSPDVSTSEPAGEWRVRRETSKIDDSTNVYLGVFGSEVSGRYGDSSTPTLAVRCKENTTAISVNWGQYISTQDPDVTWRIDDQPAHETKWSISTNYEAIGKWSGGASIPFVKKLFGHDELLMRITPHGENSVTTSFNISGLREAIKPLRQACHW